MYKIVPVLLLFVFMVMSIMDTRAKVPHFRAIGLAFLSIVVGVGIQGGASGMATKSDLVISLLAIALAIVIYLFTRIDKHLTRKVKVEKDNYRSL